MICLKCVSVVNLIIYPIENESMFVISRGARNDVIFPSGCEARAINLDNKNMKISIFTGGTIVRSKNIFSAISRYPTGKLEIKPQYLITGGMPTVILVKLLSQTTNFRLFQTERVCRREFQV